MHDRISAANWMAYAQPEWNTPNSVSAALTQVACGESRGYDNLLYAVGNNHAGTYYPVLLAVMPFLADIIRGNESTSQRTALCVIDDLFASFQPEQGFEEFTLPNGDRQCVEAVFRQQVHALEPELRLIVARSDPNSSIALQILDVLSEDTF